MALPYTVPPFLDPGIPIDQIEAHEVSRSQLKDDAEGLLWLMGWGSKICQANNQWLFGGQWLIFETLRWLCMGCQRWGRGQWPMADVGIAVARGPSFTSQPLPAAPSSSQHYRNHGVRGQLLSEEQDQPTADGRGGVACDML